MSPASLGLMVFVNLAWALNIIVIKLAVGPLGAPPLYFAGLRSLLVLVVLVPLLRPIPRGLGRVLLTGLAISGGSFALLFMGLTTTSPSTAAVVTLSGVPMTVLFAVVLLGERVGWRRTLGIALALGGVVTAMSGQLALDTGGGVLLVFASSVVGALGSVFVKRLEIGSLTLQAWAALASTTLLLPLAFLVEPDPRPAFADAPWALLGCIAFAALVVSVGAHGIYYRLLQRHDANLLVPLTLLSPLFTIALGAWLTNDIIGTRLLIGGAIALAGVAIIVRRPSKTVPKPALTAPKD